jgi:hypothetical protein
MITPSPSVTGMPSIELQSLSLDGASLSGGTVTVTDSFDWTDGAGFNSTLDASIDVSGIASISGSSRRASARMPR